MERRDWLTALLMIPFVASLPYILPPPEAGWGRLVFAAIYTLVASVIARFAAGRLVNLSRRR